MKALTLLGGNVRPLAESGQLQRPPFPNLPCLSPSGMFP
jgi:hypothetical protein